MKQKRRCVYMEPNLLCSRSAICNSMNPYYEQRLTEEVLHLHSLWRRGPPRNRESTHVQSSTAVADAANRNSSNKRLRDPKNRKHKKKKPRPEPPQDSGPEWPCSEPVQNQPSTSSGWPPIDACAPPAVAQPLSSEEQANLVALQLQYKGLEACRGFFARNADSGSDEEEEEEEGNDEGMTESEEYKFFLKLFVEKDELRGYYEKNFEGGLFCCLVCGGMGKKKSGKRFKNCVGLVQHSISISRTKKKRTHRAFGQVVCRVFGWDIDRLPTIVLKGEPLGRSLADSGNLKVQPEDNHLSKEHDYGVQNENVVISNDDNDKKNEVVSVNENGRKLEEEKAAEDPTSNAEELISGENVDACNDNDINMQALNAGSSASGKGESNTEIEILPVPEVPESIVKACKEFFAAFSASTSDNVVIESNLINGDGLEEHEEFKLFFKLFAENESLRRYYENNYDDGKFFCLVCKGAGKKMLKSFKTCGRLLQHTTSLAKSKAGETRVQKPHIAKMLKMKMYAHRAYSLVICKVLGWDIEKLPAVVLKGVALGHSLTESSVSKDKFVGNAVDKENEANHPEEDDSTKINKMQEESVGNAVGNTDVIVEDDSTKINKMQEESIGNAVGNTDVIMEDDLKKVNKLQSKSVGNVNALDGASDSMKVDCNGEATLKDGAVM